ncbi:MAG: bifunctional 4-hydroxy-2-oxoglutarate aldolase/2-dehydro-3-deoxy-phosphogluconate aldolase [Treponemataceae bacterium]
MLQKYTEVKIVPVAVVNNETEVRGLAELCLKYLPALELTLRTPYAITALEILKKDYPEIAVAAATILTPEQADVAAATGTQILISPGFTSELLEHAKKKNYTYIPGVATPAELETCLLSGCRLIKMFPAEVIGGVKWLKTLEPVYKQTGVKFMPLGGLTVENVKTYLESPLVACCGGSWLAPRDLLEKQDWKTIEERFIAAAKLVKELG